MKKPITVLVIDSSCSLFNSLFSDTAMSAFDLLHVKDTRTAQQKLNAVHVDIIVLDYDNNTEQEESFITSLRSSGNLALILILSAITSSSECVRCLSAGADDFMSKPIIYSELVARVSSLARNALCTKGVAPQKTNDKLHLDPVSLNASYKNSDLNLTKTEFRVLDAIASRNGQAISHEALIEELYGCEIDLSRNSIEVHVSAIRRKLTKAGAPAVVQTRRGFGYFLG